MPDGNEKNSKEERPITVKKQKKERPVKDGS